MDVSSEYRYNRLTWPEMNEAITAQKVVLLPTGATEQHGPHLPLDVDVFLAESVCLEVGRRASDRVLVLPPVSYGLNRHHIDFPGTVHIELDSEGLEHLGRAVPVVHDGFHQGASSSSGRRNLVPGRGPFPPCQRDDGEDPSLVRRE